MSCEMDAAARAVVRWPNHANTHGAGWCSRREPHHAISPSFHMVWILAQILIRIFTIAPAGAQEHGDTVPLLSIKDFEQKYENLYI